jgi:branched-chain amino acid transport system substrate-binding protein
MLMVLAAVGCGTGSRAGVGKTPASAPTASPVKIGFICSCSGPDGPSNGPSWPAFQAWVKYANAHGGLNGHPITVFFADDQLNPATSLAALHTMVEQDKVVAMVSNTGATGQWPTYIDPLKIPVIGLAVTQAPFSTDPNFYPEGTTQDIIPTALALAAKKVNTKFAMLYCAEAPVCAQFVKPTLAAAKSTGTQLVYTAPISATAPSYASQCLAAQQAGAKSLTIYAVHSVVTKVISDCAAQGYKPHIVQDKWGTLPQNISNVPELADGVIAVAHDVPLQATDVPELKTMTDAFNKYEPGLTTSVNYNSEVVASWATGLLLADAAKGGNLGSNGEVTAEQFISGLQTIKNDTLGGVSPPLTFEAGQPNNSVHCWFLEGTSGGKFNMAYGTKTVCGSLPS